MKRMAFIGAGRMATAIIKGLLKSPEYDPAYLTCLSAADGTAEQLASATGIGISPDIKAALESADTVVLAIKPQQLPEIADDLKTSVNGQLVVSILAGTPIAKLKITTPKSRNLVRAMPNTPGQIGEGITAYAVKEELTEADRQIVEVLLGAMGPVLTVKENELDAVTAVSGSGPAYLFEFVAGLRDAGIQAGLDETTAYRLALQTTLGATKLLKESGETPETLRDAVSSPGGTTLAGLSVMRERNFRDILEATVMAARKRSIELAGN